MPHYCCNFFLSLLVSVLGIRLLFGGLGLVSIRYERCFGTISGSLSISMSIAQHYQTRSRVYRRSYQSIIIITIIIISSSSSGSSCSSSRRRRRKGSSSGLPSFINYYNYYKKNNNKKRCSSITGPNWHTGRQGHPHRPPVGRLLLLSLLLLFSK